MRRLGAALVAIMAIGGTAAAQGYCPSYTPADEPTCKYNPVAGTNPTLAEWQPIFDIVSKGPSAWGTRGPSVPNIGSGCGKPRPSMQVAPHFPCELLKGIARQESGWKHFCRPSTPASAVGQPSRTIISFDCGYGVGQVTSGMRVADPTPSFDPIRVTNDPTYNLATGTRILADKWRATECVGDNDPDLVEDWYTATWAYNGLAYKNNPTNPTYSATRGPWQPTSGAAAPYQEKVFGWIEFPTSPDYGTAVALAFPMLGEIGSGTRPPALSEPACATPTSCATRRPVHRSLCLGGGPTPDAGLPDAATSTDGASADVDSGPTPGDDPDGSCACNTGRRPASHPTLALLALAALGLALAFRRRP